MAKILTCNSKVKNLLKTSKEPKARDSPTAEATGSTVIFVIIVIKSNLNSLYFFIIYFTCIIICIYFYIYDLLVVYIVRPSWVH